MEPIRFVVLGDPQGQPRPRAQGVLGRGGKVFAHVYNADRKRGKDGVVRDLPITVWRRAIAAAVTKFLPPEPWTGPVKFDAVFYFDRPQELLKAKHAAGLILHTSKPDLDNLLKPLLDMIVEKREKVGGRLVIARRGILRDDALVSELHVRKWYVERGAAPGAFVTLTRLSAPAPALPFAEPEQTHIGGYKLTKPRLDVTA